MPSPDPAPGSPTPDWRIEVGRFRADQPRRVFPLGLHVGVPAGPRVGVEVPWPVPATYDVGLRFDLLDALVERWLVISAGGPIAWITRPGVPELHDCDLEWHAAAVHVFAAHQRVLTGFRAVTRTGWVEVRTGERRTWSRLRLQPGARGGQSQVCTGSLPCIRSR